MRILPVSFRIQKYLAGLRYPAGKGDVFQRARDRGADAELLRFLGALPDRDYESPVSLACELGRQAERAAS